MAEQPVIQNKRLTEKIADLLYLQAPVSNGAILGVILLYFFFLRHYSKPELQFVWPALMLLSACVRLALWYVKKTSPDRFTATQWIHSYTLATGITGLAWSSILFFPYINQDIILYSGLLMIVFGVTASAVSILSVYLPAFFIYIIPILSALIFKISQQNIPEFFLLVIATIIYSLMLFLFARNTHKHIIKSIMLEFDKTELINKLQNEIRQRESLIKARTEQLERSNKALKSSEQLLKNVINGAELGYWDHNYTTGEHTVNNRWLEMLGLTRDDIINNVSDWQTRLHPDDREYLKTVIKNTIKNKKSYSADFRMKHKDGHWVWIQGSGSVIEYDQQTHEPLRLCGTHQDISYRKKIEMELEYRAKHDALTKLYNRVELEKQFKEELIRAERYQHNLSLFMIDIDHFKRINDLYGHQSGDNILKLFAAFLLNSVRTSDYVARYGGEEFVVILPETSCSKASELAERLRLKIAQKNIEFDQTSLNITISLGISSYPEHGRNYEKLLEMADIAMYQAKNKGRNCIQIAGTS